MREIILRPDIYKFNTFKDFAEEFSIGKRDLIITTIYLYDVFIRKTVPEVPYILQDSFGSGEPTDEMITKIFAAADYDSYDRVIAIGGGAVLDIGKLLVIRRNGTVGDLFWKRVPLVREKALVAIPTTSGTGSEVTSTSVAIVKDENGNTTKLGLLSEDLIASTAVLIPEFLHEIPHRPFAESTIDALIHATEAFLSPSRATMTTDMFAEKAIRLILRGLVRFKNREDIRKTYADELLTAACYAGTAFLLAGCGIVHGVSYPLSGTYLATHGAANYVFFPSVLRLYKSEKPEGKWAEYEKILADEFGCAKDEAAELLISTLSDFIPVKKMSDYGAVPEDVERFTESVFANQMRLVNNAYVPMTKEKVAALYKAVL